jgi:hypothetical protein
MCVSEEDDGRDQGGGGRRESAYTFHGPPGVSDRGRMSTREAPTMPVEPTTRATLWKECSGTPASSSLRSLTAPTDRVHHQLKLIAVRRPKNLQIQGEQELQVQRAGLEHLFISGCLSCQRTVCTWSYKILFYTIYLYTIRFIKQSLK